MSSYRSPASSRGSRQPASLRGSALVLLRSGPWLLQRPGGPAVRGDRQGLSLAPSRNVRASLLLRLLRVSGGLTSAALRLGRSRQFPLLYAGLCVFNSKNQSSFISRFYKRPLHALPARTTQTYSQAAEALQMLEGRSAGVLPPHPPPHEPICPETEDPVCRPGPLPVSVAGSPCGHLLGSDKPVGWCWLTRVQKYGIWLSPHTAFP